MWCSTRIISVCQNLVVLLFVYYSDIWAMRFFLVTIVFLISCQGEKEGDNDGVLSADVSISDSLKMMNDSLHLKGLDDCLPRPSDAFMELKQKNELYNYFPFKEKDFLYDHIYFYLYFSADSLGAKQVIKRDDFWGPVHWKQTFENGITYENKRNVEVGTSGSLYSKCTDKNDFFKVMSKVIEELICEDCYDPNQLWNADSTLYEPADQGAGCYYEIAQDKHGFYMLSWSCGC